MVVAFVAKPYAWTEEWQAQPTRLGVEDGSQCGEKVGPFQSAFLLLLLGKLTHAVQFRLPIFTFFKLVWRRALGWIVFPQKCREVFMVFRMLLQMRTNLRAGVSGLVITSDASEGGGRVCGGERFTAIGQQVAILTSGHSKSTFFPELPLCFWGVTRKVWRH